MEAEPPSARQKASPETGVHGVGEGHDSVQSRDTRLQSWCFGLEVSALALSLSC